MLTSIDPAAVPANQRPTRIPLAMVNGFFASIADGYDVREATAKYHGGQAVAQLVKPFVLATNPRILDLACGTGIAARPWRAAARTIDGVDATAAMLDVARAATHAEKPLYDTLMEGDGVALPETLAAEGFDLVLLVNAAQFMGDLAGVMRGVARVLVSGGVFAITIELQAASSGFGIDPRSSRFVHSAAYVTQTANAAGLKLAKQSAVMLYEATASQLFIFTKGNL
jgi:predicted TPR repeat methyltransferase